MPPRKKRGGTAPRRSTRIRRQPQHLWEGNNGPQAQFEAVPAIDPAPVANARPVINARPAVHDGLATDRPQLPDLEDRIAQAIEQGVQRALDAVAARQKETPSGNNGNGNGMIVHTHPNLASNSRDDQLNLSSPPPEEMLDLEDLVEEIPAADMAANYTIPTLHNRTRQFFVSKPIHAQISSRLRQKIWAGDFIDFALLLNKDEREVRLGTFDTGEDIPQLVWRQSKPKQLSLTEWTDAFHIFMSILIVKEPQEAANLLKYHNLIRSIAQENGDWRFYDDSFRRMKCAEQLAWDEVDNIALNFATSRGSVKKRDNPSGGQTSGGQQNSGRQPFRAKRKRPEMLKGYCFMFNRGQDCPGCNYKHD